MWYSSKVEDIYWTAGQNTPYKTNCLQVKGLFTNPCPLTELTLGRIRHTRLFFPGTAGQLENESLTLGTGHSQAS